MRDEDMRDEDMSDEDWAWAAFRSYLEGVAALLSRAAAADLKRDEWPQSRPRAPADLKRDERGPAASLAAFLRSEQPLTPAMRAALADLFEGKMVRGRGQRGASYPDMASAAEHVAVLRKEGMSPAAAREEAAATFNVPAEALANYLKRGAKAKG